LGRYAQGIARGLTIEQARKAAQETNLASAKGENPAEKNASRAAPRLKKADIRALHVKLGRP
jgi:hypothetical protein